MNKCMWGFGVAALLAAVATAADARPPQVRVGIGIGFPIYPRPFYAPAYYHYHRPYPVYVAQPPVYYAPPPVYYAPPPVVVQPAPVVYQQAPQARPAVSSTGSYQEPPTLQASLDTKQADSGRHIQQLFDQQERIRANAALELGRMRALQAVDPLCNLLTTDRSPQVRDTAARALGLIGDARALSALQTAAQADTDRDVRRSAQFAVEVIRANPR